MCEVGSEIEAFYHAQKALKLFSARARPGPRCGSLRRSRDPWPGKGYSLPRPLPFLTPG